MINFFKKVEQEPQDIAELLQQFRALKENFEKVSQELERLRSEGKFSIQKVGVVRFNPFKEVGGDQSFCVALLDAFDSGTVITSIYAREGNRVYAKAIQVGKAEYPLSQEERAAIAAAKQQNHQQ